MPATNTTPPDTTPASTTPVAAEPAQAPLRPDRAVHWPAPPPFDAAPLHPKPSSEPSLVVTLNRSGFDAPGQTGGAASMAGLHGRPGAVGGAASGNSRTVPKPLILLGLCMGMAAIVGVTFLLVGLVTGAGDTTSEAAEAQSSSVPSTSESPRSTLPAPPPPVAATTPDVIDPPAPPEAPEEPVPSTTVAEPTPEPAPVPEPVAASRSAAYIDGILYLQGTVASDELAADIFARAEAVLGAGNVVSEYVVDPNTFPSGDIRLVIEDTVLFDSGSALIGEDYIPLLDLSLALLNSHESVTITVVGHTDSLGSETLNAQLAHERLKSVMDYFVANGIDPDRIETQNRGESEPVASNDTADGRAKNRRVEIIIHNAFEN
jgi:outer membrane protein OmpA-like peptidoglycan-associated protein